MTPRTQRHILLTIILLWIAYTAAFLWNSTVIIHGHRYTWLFDDAMISMRYAWNLAHGHGLTWNPGQPPVEGYTNPLWTILMALLHLIPHTPATITLHIQLTSALTLLLNIILTHHLGRALRCPPAISLTAAATVALFYPLNYFSLLGMETGAQTLLYTLATLLLVQAHHKKTTPILPWIIIGITTLIRLDSYVFALATLIATTIISPPAQRRKHIIHATTAILTTLTLQTTLRQLYYHQPLPNTYYLKMTGYPPLPRILRGAYVTAHTLTNLIWPLYLLLPIIYHRYTQHRTAHHRLIRHKLPHTPWHLLIIPVTTQLLYSAYIGGDVWEQELYANRFIVIIIPHLLLLTTTTIHQTLNHLIHNKLTQHPTTTTLILAPLLILQTNHHTSHQNAWKQATLQRPPYDTQYAQNGIHWAQTLNATLPTTATITSERAGTIPYYMPHHTFQDPLGKTDTHIAHTPAHNQPQTTLLQTITHPIQTLQNLQNPNQTYTPGHNKYDCNYTLTQQKPTIAILPQNIITNHCNRQLKQQYTNITPTHSHYQLYIRNNLTKTNLPRSIATTYNK